MNKIIEAKHLGFRYAETKEKALTDVNFSILEGELVFIVGNSGSGKSTLLNLINGVIPEVMEGEIEGELFIDGRADLKIHERSLFLGNVFQNTRSQFFTTNTTAELVFEMENLGLSKEEMNERMRKIVEEFKIEFLLDREIYSISSGERQFLALMTALIMDPKVLIFDEPSANLDYGNAMRLKEQLRYLKKKGKTVLISDHRCFYLKGLIDRVLFVSDRTVTEFSSELRFASSDYGKRVFDLFSFDCKRKKEENKIVPGIRIKGLCFKHILKDINLSLNRGEVTTVIGVNGAGKTTLAKVISKVLKPDAGEIESDTGALYIMQDADFQLFGSSCRRELEITKKDDEKNRKALEKLSLWHLKNHHPQLLSGGEKQRLQLAISYISDNETIILDEPTSGLDESSMDRVVGMIEELKKEKTILIISHDYEFIRKSGDRIVYLKEGRIAEDFYLDGNVEKLNTIYKEMEKSYEESFEA